MTNSIKPSVREWARANGFEVAERGRLSPAIHKAYRDAHPDQQQDQPSNATRCNCGRMWTGLSEAHCPVCHRHFSRVRWFDDHRKGMGRHTCHDPLALTAKDGSPKYKIVENAWGPLIVLNAEHYRSDTDTAELF